MRLRIQNDVGFADVIVDLDKTNAQRIFPIDPAQGYPFNNINGKYKGIRMPLSGYDSIMRSGDGGPRN